MKKINQFIAVLIGFISFFGLAFIIESGAIKRDFLFNSIGIEDRDKAIGHDFEKITSCSRHPDDLRLKCYLDIGIQTHEGALVATALIRTILSDGNVVINNDDKEKANLMVVHAYTDLDSDKYLKSREIYCEQVNSSFFMKLSQGSKDFDCKKIRKMIISNLFDFELAFASPQAYTLAVDRKIDALDSELKTETKQ